MQKDSEKYEYNDLLQITSHSEYDLNGNPTRQNNAFLTYDALDRLVKVQTPENLIEYVYDSYNRRISKSKLYGNTAETIFYLYDGQKEIGSTDSNGHISEFRVLNPTKPSEIGSAVAIEIADKIYAPIHDLMGNIRCLISADTAKKEISYNYTAFGEEEIKGSIPNPWRFASKRTDPETGLVYFGRRYYSPAWGRWLTLDPIESANNLYAFVNNNPLTYVDLFGLYTSDRASDAHYFDSNYPETSNFSIGTIGDPDRGSINYHSGINNSASEVKQAQMALYNLFQEDYAITGHWIHNHNILHGLSLVGSEKLTNHPYCFLLPGMGLIGALHLGHSYMKSVIEYEKNFIKGNAEQILKENNPNLKQLHVLFSNASYPFREALLALPQEYRDTVIVIPCGPTTLIEKNLAHMSKNAIGKKDWASRSCHGLFQSFIERENVDLEFIEQRETKPGVFGHYFEQPDYQSFIRRTIKTDIKSIYEIY